jgi:hypothetical protein
MGSISDKNELKIFLGGERPMGKKEELLDEIFELALQNDMNYHG